MLFVDVSAEDEVWRRLQDEFTSTDSLNKTSHSQRVLRSEIDHIGLGVWSADQNRPERSILTSAENGSKVAERDEDLHGGRQTLLKGLNLKREDVQTRNSV